MTLDEFNQIKESIPEQPGIYRYYDAASIVTGKQIGRAHV